MSLCHAVLRGLGGKCVLALPAVGGTGQNPCVNTACAWHAVSDMTGCDSSGRVTKFQQCTNFASGLEG